MPDPNATEAHTVLGGKVNSKTGGVYRRSTTFPEETWSMANGQNVPLSGAHWSNNYYGKKNQPYLKMSNPGIFR